MSKTAEEWVRELAQAVEDAVPDEGPFELSVADLVEQVLLPKLKPLIEAGDAMRDLEARCQWDRDIQAKWDAARR